LLDEVSFSRKFDVSLVSWNPPAELLKTRLEQKMFLARYGRVDPFAWESRDVNDLREHHRVLVEMLQRESAARSAVEDS
jgi:hypothetical protein